VLFVNVVWYAVFVLFVCAPVFLAVFVDLVVFVLLVCAPVLFVNVLWYAVFVLLVKVQAYEVFVAYDVLVLFVKPVLFV
jgi:hypothetical protein